MPRKLPSSPRTLPNLFAPPFDRTAHELLVRERPVHVGGIEEVDAEIESAMDDVDRLRIVRSPVELRHPHAAEADRADFQ